MTPRGVPQAELASAPFDADRDDIIYQSERTRIFRRHLPKDAGTILCKEPLGLHRAARLRHEQNIVLRLVGIAGTPQLVTGPEAAVFEGDDIRRGRARHQLRSPGNADQSQNNILFVP
jgi:hypothetical protein